jgi:arylsulfatase A-like enzyme
VFALFLGCYAPPATATQEAVPPIVLVSLDTLRADRLGAYGNPDGLTPSLDHFARESVVFERAYSQSTTTSSSHASLFSSRYPSEQSTSAIGPSIAKEMATLPEVLDAYGWTSAAFVGGGHLSPELGVGRGFDQWNSPEDFGGLWHTTPHALRWLDTAPQSPYLLFVHGYDAHMPYIKPPPYGFVTVSPEAEGAGRTAVLTSTDHIRDGLLLPDERAVATVDATELRPRGPAGRARLRALAEASESPPQPFTEADGAYVRAVYDAGVAYADAQFGLLMAGLAERGVLDRAIVVVVSDHGEQLGEDGLYQHSPGASDAEAHVVLMVRLPGGVISARVSAQVELLDVMPTLLELVHAVPPAGIQGQSFAAALRGEPFVGRDVAWTQGGLGHSMLSARTPAGRLVYEGVPLRSPLASELIGAAGLPGPSFSVHDGALTEAEQAELRARMVAFQGGLSVAQDVATTLSPALTQELRAHGYWQ